MGIYDDEADRDAEDSVAGPERIPKALFEEWGEFDDQLRAIVTQPVRTPEGRFLSIGDRITPRQAREQRIPHVLAADVERPIQTK